MTERLSFYVPIVPKDIIEDFKTNFIEFVTTNCVKEEVKEISEEEVTKGLVVSNKKSLTKEFSSDPGIIYNDAGHYFSQGKSVKRNAKSKAWFALGKIDLQTKYKGYSIGQICSYRPKK